MPVGDLLPELLLVGGAVLVLLYALFAGRRRQADAAWIALGTVGLVAWVVASRLGEPQALTFFGTYAVDGAAGWAKVIVLGGTALTILLCVDWFRDDPRHGELYTLVLLAALGAIVLSAAADLMEIILGVLLSSATGYVLAGYHRRSRESGEAAIKYYLLGALSNGGMLFGAVLLFGLAGTTTLGGLREALPGADPLPLAVGLGLVVVGLAFKMGAVPAHAWMPDVADGAPVPLAGFLTSIPKVGGLIALARLLSVVPDDGSGWRVLVALLAAATMTLGNLAALWQEDIRRLLGWSAVSQTGYGLMAVVALGRSDLALPALLYFLVAYVAGNLIAFAVLAELRGLRSVSAFAGLARTRPGLALALTIAFLSFLGIPPLAGFVAKLSLFGAAIEAGYTWLAVLAILNTVVSLFYYARVIGPAYFGDSGDRPEPWSRRARLVLAVGAAALVALGVVADPVLGAFDALRLLPGSP